MHAFSLHPKTERWKVFAARMSKSAETDTYIGTGRCIKFT